MTSLTTAPTTSKLKLDFLYDSKGRRIQKLVWTNNGSVYGALYTNRFVYDGWNLVAILAPNSSLLNSFTWGSDVSGSQQGAGGVGGLLGRIATGVNTNFFAYDGNGNVATLVNTTDGTTAAQYEYGPFGEVIRVSGPLAKANPVRFSTKFQDDETDLLYYGCRFYNTCSGRWLSRDPIKEIERQYSVTPKNNACSHSHSEFNIYRFAQNSPINVIDIRGLLDFRVYTWDWRRLGGLCQTPGRVGHVMVFTPSDNKTLLSQFPQAFGDPGHHSHGTNYLYSYTETVAEEGGPPTWRFRVHIPTANEAAFLAMVSNHVHRTWWDWDPTGDDETNCARAAYAALEAGGVTMIRGLASGIIFPSTIAYDLLWDCDDTQTDPNKVQVDIIPDIVDY